MDESFADQCAVLISKTRDLRACVEDILLSFSAGNKTRKHLECVISNANRAEDLLMRLPKQWTAARWVLLCHSHEFRIALGENPKHIEIQFLPEIAQLTEAQDGALRPALYQAESIFSLFRPLDEARRTFSQTIKELQHGSYPVTTLIEFLDALLPFNFPTEGKLRIIGQPDLLAISYHPMSLFELLISLLYTISDRWRAQGQMTVQITPGERDLTLTLAIRGFRLMPAHWDILRSYDWDYQREVGCELAPLTWDEGQGQGVIVRLPWAVSPHKL